MCPERFRQQGAGLPVAIFVITVLALLVLGMAQLQESGAEAVDFQIQSQRAFLAAESGAQIGAGKVLADPAAPQCFNDTITFSNHGLSGCQAVITCLGSPGDELLTLRSEGQCGSGPLNEAKRIIEVRLR